MDFSALNWADYLIIGVVGMSTLISLIRGFVREALSLASWIIALWVGFTFSAAGAHYLHNYIGDPTLRMVVAFFVLFALTLILGAMLSFLISQIVQKTGLSGTDRLIGMIFGMGRGVLVVALVMLMAGLSSVPTQDKWWHASVLIPHFKPIASWLQGFLPDKLPFNLG